MIEYHTLKRIDNSRLVRPVAAEQLREFWRRVAAGTAMAACLLLYAWQHFQCIEVRYRIEQLESQRSQAAQLNEQLRLEVATLQAPLRVDAIARNQLGLTVPAPSQVAPAEASSDGVLAEARFAQPAARP